MHPGGGILNWVSKTEGTFYFLCSEEKRRREEKKMVIWRGKESFIYGGAFVCWVCLMLATPKVPLSHHKPHHLFVDMRNIIGVPNTLNVMTNFPFLLVGVVGFVLTVSGFLFNICLRGEVWGWVLFYGGMIGVAFGSAYYHLKPDDTRVMWDTLPMMVAYSSLLSSFVVERVGQKIGICCLFGLLFFVLLSIVYARMFNDLRMCMMFQLIPCMVLPAMTFVYQPKYTHSVYWLWAAGACLLSKFEAALDKKIYHTSGYYLSGHSLGHLFSAAVPFLLTIMLILRHARFQRLGDNKDRP